MVEMEVHHEAAQPSEALGNKSLFANHFRGSPWAAWKVFLVALTAEPMNTAAFRPHSAPDGAIFGACLVVGGHGVKSRVMALIAVFLACFRDYTPHLAPGEETRGDWAGVVARVAQALLKAATRGW
jgi:hypothetical protein